MLVCGCGLGGCVTGLVKAGPYFEFVGSELAALSASFAGAVTRVGKRASAKTMKGLRANATPMGHTANKHAAEGLQWVNDPGIWIFMGS